MPVAEAAPAGPISAAPLAPVAVVPVEARYVLHGVSWSTYDDLTSSDLNNNLRKTYDQGDLEVMSPAGKHAKVSYVIGCAIYEWMMLHSIEAEYGGNMTIKRRDVHRGIEADECYWITNAARMRGKDELDLAVDPPPDLALEVEVTSPLLPKLPIYRALGVPEIWHWRKDDLTILRLKDELGYVPVNESVELPGFPLELTKAFIARREIESSSALAKHIRKTLAAQYGK